MVAQKHSRAGREDTRVRGRVLYALLHAGWPLEWTQWVLQAQTPSACTGMRQNCWQQAHRSPAASPDWWALCWMCCIATVNMHNLVCALQRTMSSSCCPCPHLCRCTSMMHNNYTRTQQSQGALTWHPTHAWDTARILAPNLPRAMPTTCCTSCTVLATYTSVPSQANVL